MDLGIIDKKIGTLNAEIARLEDENRMLKQRNDKLTADKKNLQDELAAALRFIDAHRNKADEPCGRPANMEQVNCNARNDVAFSNEVIRLTEVCHRLLHMVSELAEISAGGVL